MTVNGLAMCRPNAVGDIGRSASAIQE